MSFDSECLCIFIVFQNCLQLFALNTLHTNWLLQTVDFVVVVVIVFGACTMSNDFLLLCQNYTWKKSNQRERERTKHSKHFSYAVDEPTKNEKKKFTQKFNYAAYVRVYGRFGYIVSFFTLFAMYFFSFWIHPPLTLNAFTLIHSTNTHQQHTISAMQKCVHTKFKCHQCGSQIKHYINTTEFSTSIIKFTNDFSRLIPNKIRRFW